MSKYLLATPPAPAQPAAKEEAKASQRPKNKREWRARKKQKAKKQAP